MLLNAINILGKRFSNWIRLSHVMFPVNIKVPENKIISLSFERK